MNMKLVEQSIVGSFFCERRFADAPIKKIPDFSEDRSRFEYPNAEKRQSDLSKRGCKLRIQPRIQLASHFSVTALETQAAFPVLIVPYHDASSADCEAVR